MPSLRVTALAVIASLAPAIAAAAPVRDDQFLTGYVTALLEQRFGLTGVQVEVENGVLELDPGTLPELQRDEIVTSLDAVEGLRLQLSEAAPPAGVPEPVPPPAAPPAAPAAEEPPRFRVIGFLPSETVFAELLADPRWPRFSASVQLYQDDPVLNTVGSANLGGTFPLYGWEAFGGIWQLGFQAGVFSIFDLEAESMDLVNADYLVALPVSLRLGPFSAQARLSHESSHLGDEFLLRARPERINLSFEALDLLLSLDLFEALRIYGGGGALFRTDPGDLDPWQAQVGLELTSPVPLLAEQLFPLAAFDVQAAEETGWNPDYSARAGLELRNELLESRRLQFMFEYYNGNSPNGQFFEREIEFFGFGINFYF